MNGSDGGPVQIRAFVIKENDCRWFAPPIIQTLYRCGSEIGKVVTVTGFLLNFRRFGYSAVSTNHYSVNLLQGAFNQARRGDPDSLDHISSVILSAAALEALMNELIHLADMLKDRKEESDSVKSYVTALRSIREQELRTKVLLIMNLTSIIFKGRALETDREPIQSAQILIKLRNELVHIKPEAVTLDRRQEVVERPDSIRKLLDDLKNRHLIPQQTHVQSQWISYVNCFEVSKWALNTTLQNFGEVVELLPSSILKFFLGVNFEKVKQTFQL